MSNNLRDRLDRIAEQWCCEHHSLCRATVTSDGLAIEHEHWHECPLADDLDGDDKPADLTLDRDHIEPSDVIDLRAERTIELRHRDDEGA